MDKEDIVFVSEGIELVGWMARPSGISKHPLVILLHGLSGVIDLDLERYAEIFVDAGYACLAYDHRNWGRSAGWPRGESDPWRQVADLREAISYARALPEIDRERIGLWGTSYAGGHVLTVSALDNRVRCAVSQVPLVSGSRTFDAWVSRERRDKFLARIDADRDARRNGKMPKTIPAALPNSETEEWIKRNDVNNCYHNELTVRSFDLLRCYEPIAFADKISPLPLLMIVAANDRTTPTHWQREAFERISKPKRLVEIDCRHYDVYMDNFAEAATSALEWYKEHL